MSKFPALRKFLSSFTLLVVGGLLLLFSVGGAGAQQQPDRNASGQTLQGYPPVQRGPRGVGGYSLTLSDIWGPAKMPSAPTDFGPHFDFPPEPLNGAPLHDPYPN